VQKSVLMFYVGMKTYVLTRCRLRVFESRGLRGVFEATRSKEEGGENYIVRILIICV
jgi:hypothetical protein